MRSSVSLGLLLWRGFAWKCSPPSQGCVCETKKKDTHTHNLPSRSMSLALSIWIIRVMLGCKKILSNQTTPFNDETLGKKHKRCEYDHAPFTTPNTNSQASITKVGHKLPERRLSLSTNARFGGYAHVGDAIPHTHSKHINFQQHDVTNQATINKYQTSIPNHHNSSLKQQHV